MQGNMQGNGRQAGKGPEERPDGLGAADGLQAAAVPMLPAMEVAEEPEKPPGGKSKDPNTYKVLSLVSKGRAPRGWVFPVFPCRGSPGRLRLAQVVPRSPGSGRWRRALAGPGKPLGGVGRGRCLLQHGLLGMPGRAVPGDGSAKGASLGHLHIDSDLPQGAIPNSLLTL